MTKHNPKLRNRLPAWIYTVPNITAKQEPQPIKTPDSRLEAQRARWRGQRKPLFKKEVSTKEKREKIKSSHSKNCPACRRT